VAFLARYSGRTFHAYRHDLRGFFQRAADMQLTVLAATRPHIELFRSWMENRGLAASTIDRRLSTVCGFIDSHTSTGESRRILRSTCAAPRFTRRTPAVWTAPKSACSCSPPGGATATTRLSLSSSGSTVCASREACATNVEAPGFERGHRTLQIVGKGNKPAAIPLVPRMARTIDLAVGERHDGPILRRRDGQRLDRRAAHRWVRSIGK